MGEVLFYRGLVAAMAVLSLVVLYKVIHPWVKALCVKLELEGEEVVKGAGSGSKPRAGVYVTEKTEGEGGGSGKKEDWVYGVTDAAKEARKSLKKGRKASIW